MVPPVDLELIIRLQEPLLVGDRKTDSTIVESMTYIPGSVLRAAFARAILAQCPYHEPAVNPKSGRYYWVEYHDQSMCMHCPWRFWCRHFGEIIFGQATPAGAQTRPFTAMECKACADHPRVDTLIDQLIRHTIARRGRTEYHAETPIVCTVCGGRMEAATGFLPADGRNFDDSPMVLRRLVEQAGMDNGRQIAMDGQLYSLRVISEVVYRQGQASQAEFVARIRLPDSAEGCELHDQTVWIGARTAQGLGKATITTRTLEDQPGTGNGRTNSVTGRLAEFNEELRAQWDSRVRQLRLPSAPLCGPQEMYAPLLLLSEADLGPAEHWCGEAPSGIEESEFRRRLTDWITPYFSCAAATARVPAPKHISIEYASMQFRTWRGWRWSNGARHPEPAHLRARMGSVMVVKVDGTGTDIGALACAFERQGIGELREDGFGEVVISHPFHMMGGK